ncbi:MAG: helix-turn-helix transcriptional regulator [Clostridia bacterium]|nr:helix-turn-helix transcriptional regulator [Clostridia bacterium]
MTIDYKLIGARIQRERKSKKLTQEQLAERLSVSVGYVSQIERGLTKANLEMLAKICTELDCELTHLFDGVVTVKSSYLDEALAERFLRLDAEQKKLAIRLLEAIPEG